MSDLSLSGVALSVDAYLGTDDGSSHAASTDRVGASLRLGTASSRAEHSPLSAREDGIGSRDPYLGSDDHLIRWRWLHLVGY